MNENDLKIVRVTNIADFDFTGDLGARYGGRDFIIHAGKSLLVTLTIGDHLAKHLAQQILLRRAPGRTDAELAGKGSFTPLWDDNVIADLKKKIISEVYEQEKPVVLTPEEQIQKKVDQMNHAEKEIEKEAAGGNISAASIEMSEEQTGPVIYRDKADVIAALEKKGVKFDARASKDSLEAQLNA